MRLIREIWYDENDRKHIKETWEFSVNPQPQIGYPIDQISPYTYPKSSEKNNLIYEPRDFYSHSLPKRRV